METLNLLEIAHQRQDAQTKDGVFERILMLVGGSTSSDRTIEHPKSFAESLFSSPNRSLASSKLITKAASLTFEELSSSCTPSYKWYINPESPKDW